MKNLVLRWKQRISRRRDVPLTAQFRDDATYVVQSSLARIWLRECDSVGPWVRAMGGRPRVENRGRIEIGERTRLICSWAPVELHTGPGGTVSIGDGCCVNFGTTLEAALRVKIGNGVDIGPYCIVSDTDVPEDGRAASGAQPIEIGDHVWLASRVTVLPGARIGEGSVITAGSIVSGEIPSRVVAGGNPARVIRRLDAPAHGQAVVERSKDADSNSAPLPQVPATVRTLPAPQHRGLLISDFTVDELARCINADLSEPYLSAEVAPFGLVVPTLMAGAPADTDFAVVWTRPEAAVPAFARLLEYENVDDASLMAEVDAFAALVREAASSYRIMIIPTWTIAPWRRGLGLVDARAGGISRALQAMNARLAEKLAAASNVFVLGAERWLGSGKGYSDKLWYMGKVPFAPGVFEEAAQDIKAAVVGVSGRARKLLVLDLDDTLWGGIVGDVGWEQLRLGGHDSVGEAFADFQRAIKSLKRRGIILAVVSKNEESVALEAIRQHPEMVLKEEDFVAYRINWQDKARNVADIVQSLNLGLQSAVFIDDNPFERARVREALPEVFVPEWPEDKLAYPSALFALRCFDSPTLSAEDLARTELYASERGREALKAEVGSIEEWLRSLELRVRVEKLQPATLSRATQLLNKTNQMNLSTRRLTEAELLSWSNASGHWLYTLSVSDRLGDAGLTGILGIEARDGQAHIIDFVLSCRVMGRRIEETMLHLAVEIGRENGLDAVVAKVLPTAKNKPCQTFFDDSPLEPTGEPHTFAWDAGRSFPRPEVVTLERV